MPVVLRAGGYTFFFYSNEGDPREPVQVHVCKVGAEAKFWLRPTIRLAVSRGFDFRALRELSILIEQHRAQFEEAWNGFFS